MERMDQDFAARLEAGEAANLANEFGLRRIGERPTFGAYLKALWSHRSFITTLASANAYAQNRNTFLGQAWLVINPMLWSLVYFTVFGILIGTRDDAENFIGFLVIGVIMFRHMSSCVTGGAKSISKNISLVRSLHFPRAVLPISTVLSEFIMLVPAIPVLFVIVGTSGLWQDEVSDQPLWTWFLLPAGLLLMTMFTTGLALIMARVVAVSKDLGNLIPFFMRAAFYLSGVFFGIEKRFGDVEERTGVDIVPIAEHQPFAVFLELFRSMFMTEFPVEGSTWAWAAGWALLFLVGGMAFFWRAEERYGRD